MKVCNILETVRYTGKTVLHSSENAPPLLRGCNILCNVHILTQEIRPCAISLHLKEFDNLMYLLSRNSGREPPCVDTRGLFKRSTP
jgi:hypothetical protein